MSDQNKTERPSWYMPVMVITAVMLVFTAYKVYSDLQPSAYEQAMEAARQNGGVPTQIDVDTRAAAERVNAQRAEPSRSTTSELTREDFNSGFAAWVGLKPGMDSDDAMAIIEQRFGETIEGEGGLTVDIQTLYRPKGLTVILATQEGALDDSIYAQQLYAEFEPVSPVANKLVFYGLRQKCQRGENTTEWTTQRCP